MKVGKRRYIIMDLMCTEFQASRVRSFRDNHRTKTFCFVLAVVGATWGRIDVCESIVLYEKILHLKMFREYR